jgi:hypothetical protein
VNGGGRGDRGVEAGEARGGSVGASRQPERLGSAGSGTGSVSRRTTKVGAGSAG